MLNPSPSLSLESVRKALRGNDPYEVEQVFLAISRERSDAVLDGLRELLPEIVEGALAAEESRWSSNSGKLQRLLPSPSAHALARIGDAAVHQLLLVFDARDEERAELAILILDQVQNEYLNGDVSRCRVSPSCRKRLCDVCERLCGITEWEIVCETAKELLEAEREGDFG